MSDSYERENGVDKEAKSILSDAVERAVLGAIRENMMGWAFANIAEACDRAAHAASRIFASIEAGSDSEEDAKRDFDELLDCFARISAFRFVCGLRRTDDEMGRALEHTKSAIDEACAAMGATVKWVDIDD